MAQLNTIHREFTVRQHRVIGHFLAIQAWLHNLDCILVQRRDVEHLLNVKKIELSRVRNLLTDVAPWFPHTKVMHDNRGVTTVYFSRVKLPMNLLEQRLRDTTRLPSLNQQGIRAAIYSTLKIAERTMSEDEMFTYLTRLASGYASPSEFPIGNA